MALPRSERPVRAPSRLPETSQRLPSEQHQCLTSSCRLFSISVCRASATSWFNSSSLQAMKAVTHTHTHTLSLSLSLSLSLPLPPPPPPPQQKVSQHLYYSIINMNAVNSVQLQGKQTMWRDFTSSQRNTELRPTKSCENIDKQTQAPSPANKAGN